MTDPFLLLGPGAAQSLIEGRKRQVRLIAASVPWDCRPGERLWIKEPFLAARMADGAGEVSTKVRNAGHAVFPNGWRQQRDGSGHAGPPPTNRKLDWLPAVHMPRWASRMTVVLESRRRERLHAIGREDMEAEGLRPLLGGLLWRWPPPARGLWRDPRRAFAAHWDIHHPTPGERWEDNPEVLVLGVRVERV